MLWALISSSSVAVTAMAWQATTPNPTRVDPPTHPPTTLTPLSSSTVAGSTRPENVTQGICDTHHFVNHMLAIRMQSITNKVATLRVCRALPACHVLCCDCLMPARGPSSWNAHILGPIYCLAPYRIHRNARMHIHPSKDVSRRIVLLRNSVVVIPLLHGVDCNISRKI